MSMCVMEFISVGYESTKYLINRFILQECRNVVVGVWLWRISGGYSQEMMGLVFRVLFFECHSSQMFWCSRSPRSPSCCIRRGENGSRFANCYESTVSVDNSSSPSPQEGLMKTRMTDWNQMSSLNNYWLLTLSRLYITSALLEKSLLVQLSGWVALSCDL